MNVKGTSAVLVVAFSIVNPAFAGEYPIPCKTFDNIDAPHRYQFEVTNKCISPACMTQHVTPMTLPAGAKIMITSVGKAAQTFTLDQPLEPMKTTRFDAARVAAKCKATAHW
jgi:hypothetical protein